MPVFDQTLLYKAGTTPTQIFKNLPRAEHHPDLYDGEDALAGPHDHDRDAVDLARAAALGQIGQRADRGPVLPRSCDGDGDRVVAGGAVGNGSAPAARSGGAPVPSVARTDSRCSPGVASQR